MSTSNAEPIYNTEIEQCVISCVLTNPETIFECERYKVCPEDFYIIQHKIIYTYIQKIIKNEGTIDVILLSSALELDNYTDQTGGLPYLLKVLNIAPTALNVAYYAKTLKSLALKRNVKNELSITQSSINSLNAPDMVKFCDDLKQSILDTGSVDELFVDASSISIIEEKPPALQTGFVQIDSTIGGGLVYGSMTVLTGDPSSGKSTLINQIIANAIAQDIKCFLYSGELTFQMLMSWFAKTVATADDLTKCSDFFGEYTRVSDNALNKISHWLKEKLFIYSKDAKADEKNLNSVIEFLAVKNGVKLFVLDNLMTLEFSGSDKYEKQISAAKALKSLAKKYDLAIILVAHPNKNSLINRTSHVFEISGASEIPNMADYVIKIIRGEENISEILIMKNRITGIQDKRFKFFFNQSRKRFYSSSKGELNKDYGYNKAYKEVQDE